MVSSIDTPERRSGRKRKLNVKYSNDAFDGLDVLSDSEKTHGNSATFSDPEDDEFGPEEAAAEVEDNEPDDLSKADRSDEAASAEEQDPLEEDMSDDGVTATPKKNQSRVLESEKLPEVAATRQAAKAVRKIVQGKLALSNEGVRDRGVRQVEKNSSRDANLLYTFGGQKEDIEPLIEARSKWFDELTIPSRLQNGKGEGGMEYSFYQTDEQRRIERTEAWEWYYKRDGRTSFQEKQVIEPLTKDVESYLGNADCQFIAGNLSQQSMFVLEPREVLNVGGPWPVSVEGSDGSRSGWIINNGEPAECLDWAPNRDGKSQFLAIGGSSKILRPKGEDAFKGQSTPAFTPASPTLASIQIWELASIPSAGNTITLDPNSKPVLRAALCVDWGPVKQFKWAPFHRESPRDDPDTEGIHLGLLAILCGDGAVRILDITLPTNPSTTYLHIKAAAFTSRPPDTVCSCLAWSTPQVLVAGCANGYLAAWNMTAHVLSRSPPAHAHTAIYTQIHTSYILTITACLPSRPSLILTSSLDGHQRLTSLCAPTTDAVTTPRARIGNPHLVWMDAVQHVLAADDAYNLQVHNVRRLHITTQVARGNAGISALAGSPVHASVLVGQADGEVCVMNPLRKTLHSTKGWGYYRQVWFRCEWRRGPAGKVKASEDVAMQDVGEDVDAGVDGQSGQLEQEEVGEEQIDRGNGLARLTTGFAVQHVPQVASKTPVSRVAQGSGVVFSTIYEEKSGIKSLAWNPNLMAGGWAAAGTGTGLVWIEDVAWDG